jgi:hypothetical protein
MLWIKRNVYEDTTIKAIRLYDYRHFKASTEYHKTKDLPIHQTTRAKRNAKSQALLALSA